MSRLGGDPHLRTATKPSSGFTSAAARLLLHQGGRKAANGESIEFFSALRKCLPDPHVSGQTTARGATQPASGRGKASRGGRRGSADGVLSLSSGIGKHDYDWLLTPPGTPPWSPATSTDHHQVSTAPSRMARAGSASHWKSNSRLCATGVKEETPTMSRLSNCSSATSVNSAVPPPRHLLRVRTSSASSINTASNASVSSTPPLSAGSSPRTPGTARSPAATTIAQTRRRDRARLATSYVVVQSRASSKSKTCVQTCVSGISNPTSTSSTSRQPSLARRADVAMARSRLASQSSGTGSTQQPRDAHQISRGVSGVASSSNGVKSRQVPTDVKKDGVAAASTTTPRWRQSLVPAIAAARNVRKENSLENKGSPARYSTGQAQQKVQDKKTRPHHTAVAAAMGSGVTRTASRKSEKTTIVKRLVNENEDSRRRDARHGGPDHRKTVLLREARRSVTSGSRLGLTAATSKGGSTSGSSQLVTPAAAVANVNEPDAFPSMRYDAMLLREDPRNLTWLRGCDEGDDGSIAGVDLVDSSLELFDVVTGLSRIERR